MNAHRVMILNYRLVVWRKWQSTLRLDLELQPQLGLVERDVFDGGAAGHHPPILFI